VGKSTFLKNRNKERFKIDLEFKIQTCRWLWVGKYLHSLKLLGDVPLLYTLSGHRLRLCQSGTYAAATA
jgi:hypothetical protein